MNAREIIDLLQLAPLPVEAVLRQPGHGTLIAEPPCRLATAEPNPPDSDLLPLDERGRSFSAFHRLPTDEVYHFYMGDPVEQWLLHDDGHVDRVVLGQNIASGQHVQHVAPRGAWQGSRLVHGGRVALLGTTMAPGFDASDYEPGRRDDLAARYPAAADVIRALTR